LEIQNDSIVKIESQRSIHTIVR